MRRHHNHRLRPDLRDGEAAPPQARQDGRPREACRHQRTRLRRLRRLQRAEQLLSVEPLETEFGRKRRINQNSCNKDFSCVKGFCPSFVTVEGGQLKKPKKQERGSLVGLPAIPEPTLPLADSAWGIVVGGVGGTGVITIGQLLGMAAHLEGKGVVTQDAGGLAQKGGATWSHVQIANRRRGHPHHQGRHRQGRPRDRLRQPSSAPAKPTLHGDAARPHLRGTEHPRHAHRRLR